MQSNQLVNFANEFDFMPDLPLITISKVLWANAGGKQLGDAKEKAFLNHCCLYPFKIGH